MWQNYPIVRHGLELSGLLQKSTTYPDLDACSLQYNKIPLAYIQQILVKTRYENENNETIAAVQKSIEYLFELNEFIRNINLQHMDDGQSLANICLHVNEISLGNELNKQTLKLLPEFTCLYLSPTNYWANSLYAFRQDTNILDTINENSNTDNQQRFHNYLFGRENFFFFYNSQQPVPDQTIQYAYRLFYEPNKKNRCDLCRSGSFGVFSENVSIYFKSFKWYFIFFMNEIKFLL